MHHCDINHYPCCHRHEACSINSEIPHGIWMAQSWNSSVVIPVAHWFEEHLFK